MELAAREGGPGAGGGRWTEREVTRDEERERGKSSRMARRRRSEPWPAGERETGPGARGGRWTEREVTRDEERERGKSSRMARGRRRAPWPAGERETERDRLRA